jgi:hypothetical protein
MLLSPLGCRLKKRWGSGDIERKGKKTFENRKDDKWKLVLTAHAHGPFVGFGSTSTLQPAGIRQISTCPTERKKSYKVERGRWPFLASWRGKGGGEDNSTKGTLARFF